MHYSSGVRRRLFVTLFLLVACSHGNRSVTIATTTSVDGSGLLQLIRTNFERESGLRLNAFVVGSGAALRLAATGKAEATITHDPEAERAFVAKYKPEIYRQFMWNDFVIVGPKSDPAHVREAVSAADAFSRIYASRSKFLSRNDESGTNMKELALWRAAHVVPRANPNYVPIGQPMAHLLGSADKLDAYTLSDRATFDNLAPTLRIEVLFAGDPVLRNIYAVALMRGPETEAHRNARTFVQWLLSPAAKQIVDSFRIRGHVELHWIG